ncbi:4Fe-4S ferredoxin [Tepiditoga spiralis]|uniref:4Fe-4S ferredoxin n=1 Tax=Tepiditoga spiralis TaxID=2108365 RepID=A0A7G1G5T5_9BACT|nr:reductive dehalogenase domain-containing protein [Tepiditoga spiralis]BBE30143.1 4Fe-4S ferredoxin [Tepiditoga spiralis]
MKKIDERDTMFARMSYDFNGKEYNDYYFRNPDKKIIDDEFRNMPDFGSKETTTYDEVFTPLGNSNFKFLADIKHLVNGKCSEEKVNVSPEKITKAIKKLGKYFGAVEIGITKMEDYHYYSYRGRNGHYGEKIKEYHKHKYGIVFAVEMEKNLINRAPNVEEAITVTQGYVKAAIIGMQLSYYIRELGYPARNHMDGNYLIIAPRVAEDAGLGEVGRNGLLTNKKYGSRIRLGVVTTDLQLLEDEKKLFGLKEFCDLCKKCSKNCLGRAISDKSLKDKEFNFSQENCFKVWKKLGTDCGVCISSCPFSQNVPNELLKNEILTKEDMDKILEWDKKTNGRRMYLKEKDNLII